MLIGFAYDGKSTLYSSSPLFGDEQNMMSFDLPSKLTRSTYSIILTQTREMQLKERDNSCDVIAALNVVLYKIIYILCYSTIY